MRKIFHNKKILWIVSSLVIVLIVIGSFGVGYSLAERTITSNDKKIDKETEKALKTLQKLVDENIKKNENKNENISCIDKILTKEVNKTDKNSVIKKQKVVSSEALDFSENNNRTIPKVSPIIYTNKPKLVIIMDDMAFKYEVKDLKKLHMAITPSFFPPTCNHPNTAKYAKEFKHYMVHFPMQATNPNFHEEPYTLHIDSSYKFIESRVEFIKKSFPNLRFVNNHTGSKFTSNLKSMEQFYKALNEKNLIFVDSVTTAQSKAAIVAKKYNKILLKRDVFLDNIEDVSYIRHQLKIAVKKAKKHGYAIAICHPHKATFEALAKSKNILKNVELIYIDDLYELAKTDKLSRL